MIIYYHILNLTNDERDIAIEVISKNKFMSDIEALKIFYTEIVINLRKENKTMVTSVITAGLNRIIMRFQI